MRKGPQTSPTPNLISSLGVPPFPDGPQFCSPQPASVGRATSASFLCTLLHMAGINEPASWGPCLSTAAFPSNYLETEEEVINNPGSQPETALPHKTLSEGPGPKGHFSLEGWSGAGSGNDLDRGEDKETGSRLAPYFTAISTQSNFFCAKKKKSSGNQSGFHSEVTTRERGGTPGEERVSKTPVR